MGEAAHFRPELFAFLRELREHNDRMWFLANKQRYESLIREPFLRFIADFGPLLRTISRHFVADPRPTGGSLFRVYRDVRFSRDKSPYKTQAAAHFPHGATGKDVHVPSFYLQLEPDDCFAGIGLWHPAPSSVQRVREAIAAHPVRWKRCVSGKAFRARFSFGGDKLKRAPSGYDPEHPCIEDLKRKDFVVIAPFSEGEACAPDFIDTFTNTCQLAAPFVEFLARALGLPW
ncbi:MAG TPA: TIGR02453 family protein [Candidatus Tectomicrobia bacterium]|nr:TIGR02453 family protein [Candidatus Tectomicrobia bacterium]